jgi:hypothetical protein
MKGGKQTKRRTMPRDTLLEAEANHRITGWLAAVESVPPGDFISIADFETLPGQVRADSYFWCDQVFRSGANPHTTVSGVVHSLHIAQKGTFDLLRHEYRAEDTGLIVTESRTFILVQVAPTAVDLLKLSRPDQGTELRRVASQILCVKGGERCLRFKLPPMLADGSIISTDPSADPWLLSAWTDRIDAGIRHGSLFFLCYKIIPQLVGFPNILQWFDDESRTALTSESKAGQSPW